MKESSMSSPGSNKADKYFVELTLLKRHYQVKNSSKPETVTVISEDKSYLLNTKIISTKVSILLLPFSHFFVVKCQVHIGILTSAYNRLTLTQIVSSRTSSNSLLV